MTSKKRKLDSYGKLFPYVENKRNTAVFRMSVYLKQKINPYYLKQAISKALQKFPDFKVTMKKSLFCYYLENINNEVKITKENDNVTSKINIIENNGYVFRISYGKKRINVDFYHILTDGVGASLFTKELVEKYLDLTKKNSIYKENNSKLLCYDGYKEKIVTMNKNGKKNKSKKYKIFIPNSKKFINKGTITHIITDLQQISSFCKNNNITITEYITSLVAKSVYESNKDEIKNNKKIKISIPVDLRKIYKNNTVSNFFDYFNVHISSSEASEDLKKIINKIKNTFHEELKPEYFIYRVRKNVKLLNQKFSKYIPLFIKTNLSKFIYHNLIESSTVILSNIGKIPYAEEYNKYIDNTIFILNPEEKTLKCSICSTKNKISISFSSFLKENTVVETFNEFLKRDGFKVILKKEYS